jgi:taurine dioxygenase
MSKLDVSVLDGSPPFGARIRGIDPANVRDPEIRGEILALFEQLGVLVFSDIESSSEMQVEIGGIFGQLRHHAMADVPRADVGAAASLMELHNDPAEQNLFEVDGRLLAGCLPWHWDACYAPRIYRGGVLRMLEATPEGGETGFADGIQMYRAISRDLRERFEGIDIVYDAGLMHDRQKFGLPGDYRFVRTSTAMRQSLDANRDAERAVHPAVWQRAAGERVLHVSPWQAAGIHRHEDPEGDALLEELCREMVEKMQPYWHRWQAGEILAWDNWRMLHAVSGHDPAHSRRIHRATIEGDYGLGRAEFAGAG